jgi:Protein of unknown function (DUF2950)
MKSKSQNSTRWTSYLTFGVLSLAAVLAMNACNSAPKQTAVSPAATTQTQSTYNSPAEAGAALLAAAKSNDPNALARVIGAKGKAFVTTGDAAEDKSSMDAFVSKYNQMNRWVVMTDGSQILHIGADNYEFPVPIKKNASAKWQFDEVAGTEEITARNIGRNELLAIDAVAAIANAEEAYFQTSHDGNPAHQYTQLIVSNPGKQDGLYWDDPAGQNMSPLGNVNDFLKPPLPVLPAGEAQVFDGYAVRILTAQGEKAKGGKKSYLDGGKMKAFAIIASPLKYRESGIMTFVMNREGVMYQKDFGPETAQLVKAIDNYNPDDEWASVR